MYRETRIYAQVCMAPQHLFFMLSCRGFIAFCSFCLTVISRLFYIESHRTCLIPLKRESSLYWGTQSFCLYEGTAATG